jgi:parallel beta-helix repeat protein
MRISFLYSVSFFTVSLTAITTALLSASSNIAIAQKSEISQRETISENSISQVNVLFVNPSIGNDTKTSGSESTPFKTIAQALRVAKENTVIRLAKGTYSAQTGEQFPLIVKSGVSIQGDIPSLGKDIIIQGGGDYLSRYYGSKNIAIVATGKAKLAGVTVTNPNPRGYGVWIESSQPVVENNTFTGSTQDGVAVMGKAAPQISNNYFYGNGANGITVSGKSQPQIKQNTFQDTGFGINIAQNASPQVISNKISENRTGVVIQASSSPVLRDNSIFNNKEDGLVVIALAIPDLGNSSNPGGNQFSSNGRYDINAEAAKQEVVAYGNTLASNKIAGKVNLSATAAPVKAISPLPRRTPTLLNPNRRENPPVSQQPLPTSSTKGEQQFNYVQVQADTIEFAAPQIASQPPANTPTSLPTLKPAPIGESALLPQQTARIPASNTGVNMSAPGFLSNPASVQNPPQLTATSTQIDSRYRVIVEAVTPRQQELVKFIVPDAFRTRRQGKRVMQAGIFSSRNKANDLILKFKNNGLKARIEPMK